MFDRFSPPDNLFLTRLEEGSIFTWGSCTEGELGIRETVSSHSPPSQVTSIEDTIVSALSVGGFHVLALSGASLRLQLVSGLGMPVQHSSIKSFHSHLNQLRSMPFLADVNVQISKVKLKLHRPILLCVTLL